MDASTKTDPNHTMKLIDEMLNLALLTAEQHQQISAWMAHSNSPEDILKMPAPLWRAIERASEVMGIDDDLMRPPALDADDIACG
jgi:glutaredoxin 2